MTQGSTKLVLEASDVAAFCETDVATIYTWVKKGEIAFFKTPGGRLRFKREAVLDFLRRYQFPIPPELAAARPRLVALDHDPTWRTQVKRALGRAFDVASFGDACDALLVIGDTKPDAVVLDVDMPSHDGLHCIHRIRAWVHRHPIRIVVFSSLRDDAQACLDAGAAAFVPKPDIEELLGQLRRLLGNR